MKFPIIALISLSAISTVHSLALSNARRLAEGLSPLRPRKLYNPNIARQSQASSTPSTPPVQNTISAYVIGTDSSSVTRRSDVGSFIGTLSLFGRLQNPSTNIKYALTDTPSEVAHGLYPVDYQSGTEIIQYMCPSNYHSVVASRNMPINLSPATGEYVQLSNCDAHTDQPAGNGPTNYAAGVEPEYYDETRVFKIDTTTGVMSMYYVNTDLTVSDEQHIVILYCPEWGSIAAFGYSVYITGNIAMFRDAYVATLSLENPDSCVAQEVELVFNL